MSNGMSRPSSSRSVTADAFSFGTEAPGMQGFQNVMTLMTAPWAACFALSRELMREAVGGGRD